MRRIFDKLRPFLIYFMIVFFIASYSLFKKDGVISQAAGRDLFFVFWMIVFLVLNFVASFVLEVFFIGTFFKKLKISINTLLIGLDVYILIYNIMDRGMFYRTLVCVIILVVAYSFYDTLGELTIAQNVLFDVVLKFMFWQVMTIALYNYIREWRGVELARVFYAGLFSVTVFLLLSLLRYIPNVLFESFSKKLILKYFIGCFLYMYIVFWRDKLVKDNFINIIEWVVVCGAFGLYFYGLISNIKKVSYNAYDPIWGKHKQIKTIIRNEEFSFLSGYIEKFVENGEKTELVEFLFGQLFRLGLSDENIRAMMYGFVEYKDRPLPKYSSRSRLLCLMNQNKRDRYLVIESTMQKFNKLMEEKL